MGCMCCGAAVASWPRQRWREPSGAGTGRNSRSFPARTIPWFHDTGALPQQGQTPAPGWAPSLAATRPLGRFWADSGPVLDRASSSLLLLPVPCPALSRSEGLWRLQPLSHFVLFGDAGDVSADPAQDYPADSYV